MNISQDDSRVYYLSAEHKFPLRLSAFALCSVMVSLSAILLITGIAVMTFSGIFLSEFYHFALELENASTVFPYFVIFGVLFGGLFALICLFFFLCACMLIGLVGYGAVWAWGQFPGTYLRISPQGLECRFWPHYRVRCDWQRIQSIGSIRSLAGGEITFLYLKSAESSGWGTWKPYLKLRKAIFASQTTHFIRLDLFEGWPEDLIRHLREHAPHAFASSTKPAVDA